MYVAWDDCEFATTTRNVEGGVSVRLAAVSRVAFAPLRARWGAYRTELALQDASERILEDIGVQRTGSGRIVAR